MFFLPWQLKQSEKNKNIYTAAYIASAKLQFNNTVDETFLAYYQSSGSDDNVKASPRTHTRTSHSTHKEALFLFKSTY